MRRKENEITDKAEIESIIKQSWVCRLAMSVDGEPYVVPLCFGYAEDVLYLHSAKEGKKIEMLKQNSAVCFEFDLFLLIGQIKRLPTNRTANNLIQCQPRYIYRLLREKIDFDSYPFPLLSQRVRHILGRL